MKVRFGLLLKFIILYLTLFFMMFAVFFLMLSTVYGMMQQKQNENLASFVAQIVESRVDVDELRSYADTKKKDSVYYEMLEQMKELQEQSGVYYLYIVVVENEEKGTYIFDLKLKDGKSVLHHSLGKKNSLKENYPGLANVIASGEKNADFDKVTIDGEKLDCVYIPILDSQNEVAAFVGIDYDDLKFDTETLEMLAQIISMVFVGMVVTFVVLVLIVRISVLRPIYRLKKHATMVSEGHFEQEVAVRGHDELTDISIVFNRMSQSIAGYMREMQILNDAYYKYVPAKILTLLKKESIEEVGLGDEVSAMLSIFAFQVADFDRSIRTKSTREMMEIINKVLHESVPVVVDREGMIEGFRDAGFTAFFDDNCKTALSGAVTICQKFNRLAAQRLIEKNKVEIGIAYGPVTLGVVGESKRMAAITVSQYRDMACFLQSVGDKYQSHILITKTAADTIPDFFTSYHVRTLGFLYNTYTGYTDRIYDVYDGDSGEEFRAKENTRKIFEQGVELYCLKDFSGARRQFIEVLKRFRKDKAAKEYLYLCDTNISKENQEKTDIYFMKME